MHRPDNELHTLKFFIRSLEMNMKGTELKQSELRGEGVFAYGPAGDGTECC